jgi:predicted phosphohydrolase
MFTLLYTVKQCIFVLMSPKIKKEDTSLVGVRLPVELRKALEKVAEDQQRTLSQEIIFRLRRSFKENLEGSEK